MRLASALLSNESSALTRKYSLTPKWRFTLNKSRYSNLMNVLITRKYSLTCKWLVESRQVEWKDLMKQVVQLDEWGLERTGEVDQELISMAYFFGIAIMLIHPNGARVLQPLHQSSNRVFHPAELAIEGMNQITSRICLGIISITSCHSLTGTLAFGEWQLLDWWFG